MSKAIFGYPVPHKGYYKVHVMTYTYNHANYIEDCMQGVGIQQTDFPFVHHIVDDASPDGEKERIISYMEAHCDMDNAEYYDNELANIIITKYNDNENCLVVACLLKKNLFMNPEKEEIVDLWRNVCFYEAHCEGDDYWIDPLKLKKQVDFLDNNPDYGMCYTACKMYNQQEEKMYDMIYSNDGYCSFEDLMIKEPATTLTIIYRLDLEKKYHEEIKPNSHKWLMGDTPRLLWFAANSKIAHIPEVTAVYRELQESASHTQNVKKIIRFHESTKEIRLFFCNMYPSYGDELKRKVKQEFYRLCIKDALKCKSIYYTMKYLILSHSKDRVLYGALRIIMKEKICASMKNAICRIKLLCRL